MLDSITIIIITNIGIINVSINTCTLAEDDLAQRKEGRHEHLISPWLRGKTEWLSGLSSREILRKTKSSWKCCPAPTNHFEPLLQLWRTSIYSQFARLTFFKKHNAISSPVTVTLPWELLTAIFPVKRCRVRHLYDRFSSSFDVLYTSSSPLWSTV